MTLAHSQISLGANHRLDDNQFDTIAERDAVEYDDDDIGKAYRVNTTPRIWYQLIGHTAGAGDFIALGGVPYGLTAATTTAVTPIYEAEKIGSTRLSWIRKTGTVPSGVGSALTSGLGGVRIHSIRGWAEDNATPARTYSAPQMDQGSSDRFTVWLDSGELIPFGAGVFIGEPFDVRVLVET